MMEREGEQQERFQNNIMNTYLEMMLENKCLLNEEQYQEVMNKIEQHKNLPHTTYEKSQLVQYHTYRVNYPEGWATPHRYSTHFQQIEWKKIRYIPYKRISHFREHLNRLQFCQDVFIPNHVWMEVCHFLSSNHNSRSGEGIHIYYEVKEHLRQRLMSRYNEHIHFMISKFYQRYLNISYEDHFLMCQLFCSIERVFQQDNLHIEHKRKNMISYYLIIQIILYIFHYHPMYKLPTVHDEMKRQLHYVTIFKIIQSLPQYHDILTLHFKRKRDCEVCQKRENLFDTELQSLL
jgi:hypothetical protein